MAQSIGYNIGEMNRILSGCRWGIKMRMFRISLILAAFMSIVFISPGAASAGSSFYIGFGTSSGHWRSSFGHGLFSHHGFDSGYHSFWCRPHYYGIGARWHRTYFPAWHSCTSGTTIHIGGCWPVYSAPRVVERRVVNVVVKEPKRIEYKPCCQPPDAKLVKEVRSKKNELLKVLQIGDKTSRIKAIGDLAGYSFDENVRKALEQIVLTDPDPDLRRQAAESMGRVKNMNLIPTLEKVRAEDENAGVREQADKAIEKIKSY